MQYTPIKRPINPNIFIFFETKTQLEVTGKNQKIRTTLRGSTIRQKIGYFESKEHKNVNFFIFFNDILTVYAVSDEE